MKRKVDKLYLHFLKTSLYFFRGFIQRLSKQGKIPVLERMSQILQLEADPSLTVDDGIERASGETDGTLLTMCHGLLLALGDLARYKGQAAQKHHVSTTALTYYSLANDLLPASGWGHHQMGVIHLEFGNHFEILYHLFRAWAVEKPHPNVASNLELEFEKLLEPAVPGSHLSLDILKARFVWLQALFQLGEPFRQHAELEQDVMSRFTVALKDSTGAQTLLQVLLINACAFQFATERYRGKLSLLESLCAS
jgi:protein SMG7